jgi:uncharacterized membrane protein YdbT with pleckstrin-like domain
MAVSITQKPGEEILLTLRKNPNKFSASISKFLLLFLAGVLLFVFFQNQYVLLAAIIILLVAFSYGLYYFILWFYDVYIITNKRVVLVNQKSLFSREFVETDIEKIQDVTYSIKGIFATIFKYGTVQIRTSTGLNLELTDLSDPDEIQEMLKNLADVTHQHHKNKMSAEELIGLIQGTKK